MTTNDDDRLAAQLFSLPLALAAQIWSKLVLALLNERLGHALYVSGLSILCVDNQVHFALWTGDCAASRVR